jgi:hypothetical protein
MKTGILYALFNDEENPKENELYQHHLLMSITSVRKFNDLPITVITNCHDLELDFDNVQIRKVNFEECFPKRYIEGSSQLTRWCNFIIRKLEVFKHYLPYEITIYSDVDILFLDDPKKIIDEKFDLSIARETRFNGPPRLCHMLNTGLFAAKNDPPFNSLIEKACDIVQNKDNYPEISEPASPSGDQYYIHAALDYIHDIDIKILPAQWNVRNPLIGKIKNPKVIHTKNLSLKSKFIC